MLKGPRGYDMGEEGRLQVRARYAMAGCLDREQATQDANTQDGRLRTGDTAILRADGNIEFVGRSELLNSGGCNVYQREIELALEEMDDMEMSAVISVPDPLYGKVGWAYVIASPGNSVNCETWRSWCQQWLANYEIPKWFLVVEQVPVLPIGKTGKVRLRVEANAEPSGR